MKGVDVISTIHYLKLADHHLESFIKDRPQAALTRHFREYRKKINWMFNDIKSEPIMPQVVRDGINQELSSDIFSIPAIYEKISLLPPGKREIIEEVIDRILKGEEIEMEIK